MNLNSNKFEQFTMNQKL